MRLRLGRGRRPIHLSAGRTPPTAKPAPTRELLELIVGNPLPAGWGRMVGEGGGVGVGERATIQTIHSRGGAFMLSPAPFPPYHY